MNSKFICFFQKLYIYITIVYMNIIPKILNSLLICYILLDWNDHCSMSFDSKNAIYAKVKSPRLMLNRLLNLASLIKSILIKPVYSWIKNLNSLLCFEHKYLYLLIHLVASQPTLAQILMALLNFLTIYILNIYFSK